MSSAVAQADIGTNSIDQDVTKLSGNTTGGASGQDIVGIISQIALGEPGNDIVPRDAAVRIRLSGPQITNLSRRMTHQDASVASQLGHQRFADIIACGVVGVARRCLIVWAGLTRAKSCCLIVGHWCSRRRRAKVHQMSLLNDGRFLAIELDVIGLRADNGTCQRAAGKSQGDGDELVMHGEIGTDEALERSGSPRWEYRSRLLM